MQGLPFDDESEFTAPPAVSVSTTWMEHSPRLITPQAPNSGTVTEEDLYRIVAAQQGHAPPQHPHQVTNVPNMPNMPQPDLMQRYSQQIPVMPSAGVPIYSHAHPQVQLATQQAQGQLSQHPTAQFAQNSPMPQQQRSQVATMVPHSAAASFHRGQAPTAQQQQQIPARIPPRRQRVPVSQPVARGQALQGAPAVATSATVTSAAISQRDAIGTKQELEPQNLPGSMPGSSSSGAGGPASASVLGRTSAAPRRKAVRSAVEEARLRAQREAESYANSRKDPTKREAGIAGAPSGRGTEGGRDGNGRVGKRSRQEIDSHGSGEGANTRRGGGKEKVGEERGRTEDDSEAEKQERYKRRLDMNRESAAVSRVRRRAYVKELEERLAAVEAEKLQLEGKLEIMMSQNEGYKKQLEELFMMVASGRPVTYPQAPPPPPPPSAPSGPSQGRNEEEGN